MGGQLGGLFSRDSTFWFSHRRSVREGCGAPKRPATGHASPPVVGDPHNGLPGNLSLDSDALTQQRGRLASTRANKPCGSTRLPFWPLRLPSFPSHREGGRNVQERSRTRGFCAAGKNLSRFENILRSELWTTAGDVPTNSGMEPYLS